MRDEKSEGLVLRAIDYKDRQRILTLLTPNRGMISLIVKGITRKKSHLIALTTPLIHAEFHYTIHRSELYTFRDGTPLATHSALRTSLGHLEAGTTILQALLHSQLPGKPAPDLFHLALAYLRYLPRSEKPSSQAASFVLKLLKHEGLLALGDHCSHCSEPATHLADGEGHCAQHAPSHGIPHFILIQKMIHARDFSQIDALNVPEDFDQEIYRLIAKGGT